MGNRHAGVWVSSVTLLSISLFQLQAPSPGSWDVKNLVNSLEAVFFLTLDLQEFELVINQSGCHPHVWHPAGITECCGCFVMPQFSAVSDWLSISLFLILQGRGSCKVWFGAGATSVLIYIRLTFKFLFVMLQRRGMREACFGTGSTSKETLPAHLRLAK